MAENAQERTEKPTPKRIQQARERGQVPRSVELSAATVMLIGGASLYLLSGRLGSGLHALMRTFFTPDRDELFDDGRLVIALGDALMHSFLMCLPLFVLTVLAALAAPALIGGWNVSTKTLVPDLSRLNPLSGFKRMFSARSVVELGKAFAKFGVVAAAAAIFLRMHAGELLTLGSEPTSTAIGHAIELTGQAMLMLAAAIVIVAAVDVPWQLWQHLSKLRMTRQEIRDELKETEGSPEIKSRIRSVQQELARRRMMQEIPKADVVVVNPTHYSVALRYDERRMRAPVVVAKGVDAVALRIREIAAEHRVPIFEAPPLARALYRSVDIGAEIPASLYVAVAQVLTYVYQLRAARRTGEVPPVPPKIDPSIDQTRH